MSLDHVHYLEEMAASAGWARALARRLIADGHLAEDVAHVGNSGHD